MTPWDVSRNLYEDLSWPHRLLGPAEAAAHLSRLAVHGSVAVNGRRYDLTEDRVDTEDVI
jgi:hypothetical protein